MVFRKKKKQMLSNNIQTIKYSLYFWGDHEQG